MNKIFEVYNVSINESTLSKSMEMVELGLSQIMRAHKGNTKSAAATFSDAIDNLFTEGTHYADKYDEFIKDLKKNL